MEWGRRPWKSLLVLVSLGVGLGPAVESAEGQYFGRNKVQYETFDFRVLETEHFDVHYYPAEREAAEYTGRLAERWYTRLSRLFDHELRGRQPLILYASHPHFEQTTTTPGTIDEATGGFTEALKRRIVMPLAGPLSETDHVLGHELVHAFQYDITTRSTSVVARGLPTASRLPLWFIEGMAEYLTSGPKDAHTSMWMRDAARRDEVPSLHDLNSQRFFPYRYGQAMWAYIAGRWGDQTVGEIMKAAGNTGDPLHAIVSILRVSPDSLSSQWRQATRSSYESLIGSTQGPEAYGRALVTPESGSGHLNIAPALSPDGRKLVFLSEKDLFSIEMFLADVETGEIERKILKTAHDPHFESLQFIYSSGVWSPDGRRFAFAGVSKGKPILSVLDVEDGKIVREHVVPEAGEILNPTWSPDGRRIAFSAIRGGFSDLLLLDVETGDRRLLTRDAYADLHPAWSPDGRSIAFTTDRFTTDLDRLAFGDYRLGLIDVESGDIEELPFFRDAKHIDPQWGPDGSLYFLSDANGITNVYRIEPDGGAILQVTNLLVGVSGITATSPALSVASDAGRMVFSAYEGDHYTLYVVDSPEVLAGELPTGSLAEVSPAFLPPQDRPIGDVMALLDNDRMGLPETGDFSDRDYASGLSLDYVAPPQFVVGADRFGTFVGGGSALFWSDMLGRHSLATMLQINGSFEDIAALVGYQNQKSRWNWAVVGAQIPIVTLGFGRIGTGSVGGQPVLFEELIRFRQINREISGVLSYPFNRVRRVEFTGGFRNITYSSEIQRRAYSQFGDLLIDEEEDLPDCSEAAEGFLCDPEALNLFNAGAALVYDNSFFGGTSPMIGQRYRMELAPTVGSLNFLTGLADYRRYLMPIFPYTLAFRVMHFGRYGGDAEDPRRIQPLFIGYQQLIRGYGLGSFRVAECGPNRPSSSFVGPVNNCPAFDQLLGSRLAVANLELRFPLLRGLGLGNPSGFPPLELAFFFDAGAAWWSPGSARDFGGNMDPLHPVTSYGVAMRANLFGVGVLELDYAHPNDRPNKGWMWQVGFIPGF